MQSLLVLITLSLIVHGKILSQAQRLNNETCSIITKSNDININIKPNFYLMFENSQPIIQLANRCNVDAPKSSRKGNSDNIFS